MSRNFVSYKFSENDKNIIVSRLLGEHFSKCDIDEQGRYCGYIDDTLCEVKFFTFMVSVFRRDGKECKKPRLPKKNWVNLLYRKLFQDKTLDFEKEDKKDFNRYAYAEVDYDNMAVDFVFRYKPMEDAV